LLGKVWEQVYQAERQVLEAISVEKLAGQQRVLEQERSLMYHI
jgi:DNA-binding IscR family transcriptional regulator